MRARAPRTALTCALAFALAACGGKKRHDDAGPPPGDAGGDAGGRDTGPPPPPPDCDGAAVLGAAGTTTVESVALSWFWGDGWSEAAPVTVAVPGDLESLLVAVVSGDADAGLKRAQLDARVLFDLDRDDPELTGEVAPFFHGPVPAGAVMFPIDEGTALSAGCLSLSPVALDDLEGQTGTLYLVSRRRPAGGVLDVNAIVVGATDLSTAEIDEALGVLDEIYRGAGAPGLGTVTHRALDWPDVYVDAEGPDANELHRQVVTADQGALNIYFVQDFLETGTLGVAAGVPGPNGVHGTAASGMMVSVDTHLDETGTTLDATLMGETIAHELAHQLGLFHTSEADGFAHDALEDTAECPVTNDTDRDREVSAEECLDLDGRNLMFWTAGDGIPQRELSPAQVRILSVTPVAR